jgi:hypothetical protein
MQKVQNQMLDGGVDRWPGGVARLDEVWLCCRNFRLLSYPAAPKEIDAVIVCDAK